MKKFTKYAAQGDLLLVKIDALPEGLTEVSPVDGQHTVAHSETGHHHTLAAGRVRYFRPDEGAFSGYVQVKEPTPLVHHRPHDTHEPILLDKGVYEIRRQREYTPKGYRRVED